jgi:hypothetical protein
LLATTFTATTSNYKQILEAGEVVNQKATAKATLLNGFVISDISDDPTVLTSTTKKTDPTVTIIN